MDESTTNVTPTCDPWIVKGSTFSFFLAYLIIVIFIGKCGAACNPGITVIFRCTGLAACNPGKIFRFISTG